MQRSFDRKKTATQKAPANALYRSRIEICRILLELAGEACPIFAEVGDERLFVTRILLVDERSGYLAIEYGMDKSINSALFGQSSLKFRASYLGAYLIFKVSGPQDVLLDGKPAIRFALPRSLVWSNRREHSRVAIPPNISLRCIIRKPEGGILEAQIFDISLNGIGGMVCEGSAMLPVGALLHGCRIFYPGGEPITVDLVVRNSKVIARPDGTCYTRTGLRFIQRPEEIRALLDFFVHDLDGAKK